METALRPQLEDVFDEVIENQLCDEPACGDSGYGDSEDEEDPPELKQIVTQLCDANRQKQNKIRETWVARQLLQMYKEEVEEARNQMQDLHLNKEQLLRDRAQLQKELEETREACEQMQAQLKEAQTAVPEQVEPGIAAYRQEEQDSQSHRRQRRQATQPPLAPVHTELGQEEEPAGSPSSQGSADSSSMHVDSVASDAGQGPLQESGPRVCRSLISQISIKDFSGMEAVLAAKLDKADQEINRLQQIKEHEFKQRQVLEEMNLLMVKKIGRLSEFLAHIKTGGLL